MKKKEGLKECWDLIDMSVIIVVFYTVVNLIFPLQNIIGNTLSTILALVVTVFAFGLIGYKVSREKNIKAVRAGVYAGVIIGIASAVLSIIAFYLLPDTFAAAINQAVQSGAPAATA